MLLSVCCWKWKSTGASSPLFGPEYVNRLRAALERHLHVDHELVVVTDDPSGIDRRVRVVPLPTTFANTPRCRRRMQIFSRDFASQIGARILTIDLDVVIVDDITPLVDRAEPIVCWLVDYAQVYSGSFHLMNAGVLDGLWCRYETAPEAFPKSVQKNGTPSDQAMLNWCLRSKNIPYWNDADGLVTYFGEGYKRFEHLGIGPGNPKLPKGARVVVLGSADKAVMDEGRYDWVREHWSALPGEGETCPR